MTPQLIHKNFRYQKPSDTLKRCSTKILANVRETKIWSKVVIPSFRRIFWNRKLSKSPKSRLREYSLETKSFRNLLLTTPLTVVQQSSPIDNWAATKVPEFRIKLPSKFFGAMILWEKRFDKFWWFFPLAYRSCPAGGMKSVDFDVFSYGFNLSPSKLVKESTHFSCADCFFFQNLPKSR